METTDSGLTRAPGLYLLGLVLAQTTHLTIGTLGTWELPAGLYVYVGSAWGPGGLAARVGRHLRGTVFPHWHIDALRAGTTPLVVWLAPGAQDECARARRLLALPAARIVIPRFGASDCRCPTHLVTLGPLPAALAILQGLAEADGWLSAPV